MPNVFQLLLLAASLFAVSESLYVFSKHHRKTDLSIQPPQSTLQDGIKINLHRADNVIYYANITVGTPPQNFTVYIDMSQNYFWLPSTECDSEDEGCNAHHKYNSSASTTFHKDGTPAKVWWITGHLSKDTACISSACASNQTFMEATKMTILDVDMPNDGALGLGRFDKNSTGNLPFLYSLIEQKQILPLYSIWLNGTSDYVNNDIIGGELTLGGINHDRYTGPVTWVPALEESTWSFKISNMKVNGKTVGCFKDCTALFNNNLNKIIGQPKEVKYMHEKLGNFKREDCHGFTYYFIENCTTQLVSSLPSVTIKIGNADFTLTPNEYIDTYGYKYSECTSRFMSIDTFTDTWILGSPFMAKYFTIIDIEKEMIGLAAAVNNQ